MSEKVTIPCAYWLYANWFDVCGCHPRKAKLGINATHGFESVGKLEIIECRKCGATWEQVF